VRVTEPTTHPLVYFALPSSRLSSYTHIHTSFAMESQLFQRHAYARMTILRQRERAVRTYALHWSSIAPRYTRSASRANVDERDIRSFGRICPPYVLSVFSELMRPRASCSYIMHRFVLRMRYWTSGNFRTFQWCRHPLDNRSFTYRVWFQWDAGDSSTLQRLELRRNTQRIGKDVQHYFKKPDATLQKRGTLQEKFYTCRKSVTWEKWKY